LPLWLLVLTPLLSPAQTLTNDAISREVSVFNCGPPSANVEAISREVSVLNFGPPSATVEAVSREVSLFNFGPPCASVEAISREVSVYNFGPPSAQVEAISRELSVYNCGVVPVVFSVGSTNLLGNQSNQVPFSLQTVLDLANLRFSLNTDDSRLQILGLTPVAAEVISAVSGTTGANGHAMVFALNPGVLPVTNHVLAYLNLQGITNLDSAIVPLRLTGFTATSASGQPVPFSTSDGQVVLIVAKPILSLAAMPQSGMTMYGLPGATYAVQTTTNLAPAQWYEVERLVAPGPMLAIPGLVTNAPQQFYRTLQVGP
jgi:hypothetical protein